MTVNLHILRATNWWNTSRMFGSRSCVKSNVSKVELYLSTCKTSDEIKGSSDDGRF